MRETIFLSDRPLQNQRKKRRVVEVLGGRRRLRRLASDDGASRHGCRARRGPFRENAAARAMRDPELIGEAQKGGWVIEPVSGEDLQSLADRLMVQPV